MVVAVRGLRVVVENPTGCVTYGNYSGFMGLREALWLVCDMKVVGFLELASGRMVINTALWVLLANIFRGCCGEQVIIASKWLFTATLQRH